MAEGVTVQTPDGSLGAYLARPARPRAPAIVVIQEIFGVNAVMRSITDRISEAGYLAICPDLFWRIEPGIDITDQSEAEMKRAFDLFGAFQVDKGVEDIGATIGHIRKDSACTGSVGAVGFCLGGLLAFLAATRTDIDASVAYYGVGIEDHLAKATGLAKPLMLHIAEEDQFVPEAARHAIRTALEGEPQVTVHRYPGHGHAFARPGGEHYDAEAAALAWRRTCDFFDGVL